MNSYGILPDDIYNRRDRLCDETTFYRKGDYARRVLRSEVYFAARKPRLDYHGRNYQWFPVVLATVDHPKGKQYIFNLSRVAA